MPTYKNSKLEVLEMEQDDLQGITQLCIDSLKRNKGRPHIYAEHELDRFMSDVTDYFKTIHDKNADAEQNQAIYPSIESLCVFLSITRDTLWRYGQRSAEWKTCIELIRNCIASVKMQLASHGKIPPLVFVFDMTNNYQYCNTSEFKLNVEPQPQQDAPMLDTKQLSELIEDRNTADLPKLPD